MIKDIESIIKEMEGEIAILNCVIPTAEKKGECTELRKGMRKAISYYLNRIKKLNEAIVSEDNKCDSCKHRFRSDTYCFGCKYRPSYEDRYEHL